MYILHFSRDANKFLVTIPKPQAERIYNRLHEILDDPLQHIQRLHGGDPENPLYRFRVGDYRVIMQVLSDVLIVYVVDIGHRRNVYRKH